MNSFALCELCNDNGPFYCCFSACDTCGDTANYCAACWNKWVTICEDERRPQANCPHCRAALAETTVETLMGRPYKYVAPRRQPVEYQCHQDNNNNNDPEETTTVDMRRHDYRRCPTCRTWIERTSGCDDMQCICGSRFCYQCGHIWFQCNCMPVPVQDARMETDAHEEHSTRPPLARLPPLPVEAERVRNLFSYWSKLGRRRRIRGQKE